MMEASKLSRRVFPLLLLCGALLALSCLFAGRASASSDELIAPVHDVYAFLASDYGSNGNTGIDIAFAKDGAGKPVFAAQDGVVTFAGWDNIYGQVVRVTHGDAGLETWYSQCSKLLVSKGDLVLQGQQIAKVGKTGDAPRNQLHFEVRVGGATQNPRDYIPDEIPLQAAASVTPAFAGETVSMLAPIYDPSAYISTYYGSWGHRGVDIAFRGNGYGKPIYAAESGTVTFAGWDGTYGQIVRLRHGDSGIESWYAHCSKMNVRVGDTVLQGQVIAQVGSTGRSTGNHCHFEVYVNGVRKNPLGYIPSRFWADESVETTDIVTYEEPIPFKVEQISSDSLYQGMTEMMETGMNGLQTVTAEVTLADGVEISRRIIATDVVEEPVAEQIAVGSVKI